MIGDSWFWYPFGNLATELGGLLPEHQLVVVGNNGSGASEWATKLRFPDDSVWANEHHPSPGEFRLLAKPPILGAVNAALA